MTRALRDGEALEFADRRLQVLHRPGHSRSDTVLYDDARGVLVGADHVMRWPSIPLMSPPLDGAPELGRRRALAEYKASLLTTQAMEVDDDPPRPRRLIRDPASVIDTRLRLYERRIEEMLAVVDTVPTTAIELTTRTRGEIAEASTFFALCDTLGYLDELIGAGLVAETDHSGVAHFARI